MKKFLNRLGIYYCRGATAYELQIRHLLIHMLRPRFILSSGITKGYWVPTDDGNTPWRRLWGYQGTVPYFLDPGPRIGRIARFLGCPKIRA